MNTHATEQVLDLARRWAEAEQGNNADALDGLLAEDFVAVGPLGFILNRQQWLGRYRGGDLRNRSFELQEPAVHDHGAAAVVVGTQVQQTSYQGHDTSGRFRATVVAVRPNDAWRIASVHLSPIGEPPSFAQGRE